MEQMNEMSIRSKLTIALDENLLQLKEGLKASGFKVMVFKPGTQDHDLFHLMQGMSVLTKNDDDFQVDAVIHDFDIISIKNLKFIDGDTSSKNKTVSIIAKAIRQSKFYNKRGNWLLNIMNDGSFNLEQLV